MIIYNIDQTSNNCFIEKLSLFQNLLSNVFENILDFT